jgi:hypothetical protein
MSFRNIQRKLNRSPEGGEGGGSIDATPPATEVDDKATIEKLGSDIASLTANNQKLLGEMNGVRTLNNQILQAFGVSGTGSAEEKIAAVQGKLDTQQNADSSKTTELSELQSKVSLLSNNLAEITKSQKDATQAKDKLTAEGEIRKQLVDSKVFSGAHDMVISTVLGKSDQLDGEFGVNTNKGRVSLAEHTKSIIEGLPQIVEVAGKAGANATGGAGSSGAGVETYETLIASGRYTEAMALKNK